jgi:hypothetical protein
MKEEMSKPRIAKWTIAIAHHPLFSNGDHGDNGVLQSTWGPLFKQYNLDFYVCGHDHDLQHIESKDYPHTSFLLCGGGGAETRPMKRDNRGEYSQSRNGVVHLHLTDQGADIVYVGRQGEVIHQFSKDAQGNLVPGEPIQRQPASKPTAKKAKKKDPADDRP